MKKLVLITLLVFVAVELGCFIFVSVALAFSPTYLSFNNGQVSPLLEARTDYDKYSSSCRTIENMLVCVQGPVQRRPGTRYIETAFSQGQYGFGVYGTGTYGQ